LTNGPIPAGQCALHRCDTPACVNPAHIFLGTRKDNSADAISKLRHAWGERSIHAKLTEEQVLEIRRLRDEGLPRREIAERYGIRPDSVYLIASRRIWKHLP